MKKNHYRAKTLKQVNFEKLSSLVEGERIVFGVDVAKVDFYGVFMNSEREILVTVKWKMPRDLPYLIEQIKSLRSSKVEVALEPSGSYGDTFVASLKAAGFEVYMVSPKRSNDASEVYDGVPSSHDAKSAYIISRLHWDKISKPWPEKTVEERKLAALIDMMAIHDDQYRDNLNRLEAKLARFWPEITEILSLDSVTLLRTIENHGGPVAVAKKLETAAAEMKRIGGSALTMEKCQKVVESAVNTTGVAMLDVECEMLKKLAAEILRNRQAAAQAKSEIERCVSKSKIGAPLSKLVGRVTAAILVVTLGDPSNYRCAAAYQKAMGLNLKERSSGKYKGKLKITKRGSGIVRQYLYLATLRLLQSCKICRAWYNKKVIRDGGRTKSMAVIAVTRKLSMALWYVGQGVEFDASKLFDARRLGFK